MSIIMSAGNKKVEWSPKDEKVVKTASTQGEVKEEVNALYEAAKIVVEAGKDCKKCGSKKCECGGCKCEGKECTCKKEETAKVETAKEVKAESKDEKKDEKKEVKEEKKAEVKDAPKVEACDAPKADAPAAAPAAPKMDDKKDVVQVDLPPKGPEGDVVVEPVAEEATEATKMESAVEKIEEAVVDLKELVQEEKGELGGDVDEVEIEVDDAGVPGEEVSNSEIIVQSEPGVEGCMAKGKGKVEKAASTEEEFCRFAKLSPANKAKLANYWTNMLGYPKDWVDLLTKDYEK